MFDSIRNFLYRTDRHQADRNALEAEAKQFKLPSETLPQILKYIFFAGLAALNFRLFREAVPGAWGTATGIVAMLAEILALYALHYFSRSAGLFRLSLGASGFLLMGFSLVHGTFSILDLVGVREISRDVQYYSRVIAFPLLAGLITLSVVAITMCHPKNVVRLKQAIAHTRIAIGRAEAASELELGRAQYIIEQARLENTKERTRQAGEFLQEFGKLVEIKQQERRLIGSIADPDLRQALAREMGIPDPGHQQQEPTRNLGFPTAQDNRPKAKGDWI
jgi:hypothetical protein